MVVTMPKNRKQDKKQKQKKQTNQTKNKTHKAQNATRKAAAAQPKHVTHVDANTLQPFPGSRHKKTQCCLTVNSMGPHAIASFLDRCLLQMDMPFRTYRNLVLSTKTDTSFRQIHEPTEQNPNTKMNFPENPSKIFPCKCKVSSLEKKQSLNLLETCQGRTVSNAFEPVSVATPPRNLHTHI